MNRGFAYGCLGILLAGTLLEVVVRSGLVSPEVFPAISSIVVRAAALLANQEVQIGLAHTIQAWAIATFVAALLAVMAGIAVGLSRRLYDASLYLIDLLRPVPSVGLLPAAILLFGLGLQMKVSLAVYAAFWPMLLNTIYGVTDVDRGLRQAAMTLRWSPLRVSLFVVLPAAAPYIATGIRLGASVALIVVLTTEILAARNGFGHVLTIYQSAGESTLVYAGILITGLLGLLVNLGLAGIERRLIRWTPAVRV
jgi:ABC-type nitrate/sulfonate/bicarbonate transport system permease component